MSQLANKPIVRHVDGHTLSHLHHVQTSTTSLVPIITPPIRSSINKNSSDDENNKEQYILVPNSKRIVVRSAQHGKKICDLIVDPTRGGSGDGVQGSNANHSLDDADIRAVTLAWLPSPTPTSTTVEDNDHVSNGEWVILAGCKNGMVHEWSVSDLSSSSSSSSSFSFNDVGSGSGNDRSMTHHYYGRVSRRSFQLVANRASSENKSPTKKTALELLHLTCPSSSTEEYETPPSSGGRKVMMLYGLVTTTTMDTAANNSSTKKKNKNKKNASNNDVASSSTWLIRMEIPPFEIPSQASTTLTQHDHQHHPLPIKTLLSVKEVPSKAYSDGTRQDKFVCLKTNDSIFGFLAFYRKVSRNQLQQQQHDRSMLQYMVDDNGDEENEEDISTSGDVFVVMCSSHGLAVYRDSLRSLESSSSSSPFTKLVHFTKIMKSSNNLIPREEMIVTSLAISPGANDLALGRGGGQIDILDNVFENVASFLDRRKQLIAEKKRMVNETNGAPSMEVGESDSLQQLWQHHPEEVTIRRTVHWHAHAVRTLTFISASSGRLQNGNSSSIANPMSLLSGGEESVLVTWQLDRNFHRPSHFVARVGRGGIVHMLTCRSSGKVIVFCSDNSIQCFDGSTYERDWAEFGLAAMALHGGQESAEADGDRCRSKRSAIVMVKDPITNIPMLTNLPGAPGMIHWYDPNLASVVGTLEVAPYNRVSRRDPSDPHVPEPTVTHMAVGQSGKDMVTVDTVWTENTIVGAARDLIGPKGSVTRMNVITCIKFWTHVDSSTKLVKSADYQRKRRSGDVPMSYELVASMSAPHGREGMVCALAIAPNGSVACTLSQEEDAFRIWAKRTNDSPPSASGASGRATVWKCLYVVKTPSGFANLLAQSVNSSSVGQQLVAFSSDGTVLSVSYGPYVTLWDHSNVTLLTSISVTDNTAVPSTPNEKIETVNFLPGHDDAMLLTTAHQIRIKSPFGGVKSYLGDDEWLFCADSVGKDAIMLGNDAFVSAVSPLEMGEGIRGIGGQFAVSITFKDRSKSIISIVNRDRGEVVMLSGTDTPICWQVEGEVQSLCVEKHLDSGIQLLAVMKDCRMLSLSCGTGDHTKKEGLDASKYAEVRLNRLHAPVLKLGNKVVDAEKYTVKRRKVSIGMPHREFSSKRNYSGFEFPALSGKFTSALIARGLGNTK